MMNRAILLVSILLSADLARAEVRFADPPAVARSGERFTITFALTARSDVEVAVTNAAGEVVRHLAAGVLGGDRPPPPPLRPGLSQSLSWDGADDRGKPARGGPFKVQVRAGMRARLGGFIGSQAVLEEKVFGLATDRHGQLFAATGGGYGKNLFTIKVFDRDGRYLRTIMPFPATLKPNEIAGLGKAGPVDGKLAPAQHDALLPWLYLDGLGTLIGNRVEGDALWLTDGSGHICRLRASDGACLSWGAGARAAPAAEGPICWAIAPGGRTLYLAGWYQSARGIPDGQLFAVDPRTGERAGLLSIPVPSESYWLKEENGWYHFVNWGRKNGISALHGVAVDEGGRIYLCDRVNGRLSIYGPKGDLLGGTKVEAPDLVALSTAGPEIYVSTRKVVDGYKAQNEIGVLKLSGWNDGRVLASLTLEGVNAPSMAVDSSARPAVIWISNVGDGGGITRIEDGGDRLTVTGKLADGIQDMPTAVVKVWADRASDDVIVSNGWSGLSRFDGITGRRKEFPLAGIDLAFGPDGEYHVYGQKGWHELVARSGRDFRPLPFSATGKDTTTLTTTGKDVYGRYGHGWSNKGLAVGPDGRIYVYNMYDWSKYFVNVWDASGQGEKHSRVGDGLLGPLDPEGGGLAVDFAGNIYVGLHGFPKAYPGGRPTEGSVVKFGPGGGGYAQARGSLPGIEWRGSAVGRFLEGALDAYPGLGSQVSSGCVCKEARFDLDLFGRLYIPNALDYHVRVVDNAGNEILRFGAYGNPDSRGPESAVPRPEVPLGWPFSVSVGRAGRVYVADTLNHRVVRVDLTPEISEEQPLP